MRTSPSPMPAAARCSGVMRLWVVVAGWVMVVLVSPRLAVIDSSPRGVDQLPRRLLAALQFEGDDAAAGLLLAPSPVRCCGCDGRPGYSTRATCGCASSHCASASALFECASIRIDSVSRPLRITQALNGRQRRPGGAQEGVDAFHQGLAAEHRAAEHPALAVEILGGGMDDDVGAQFQRLLQRRRAEAVVDRQPGACGVSDVGQRADVAHFGERIGRRFDEEQSGVRLHRRAPFRRVGRRHVGRLDAEAAEDVGEQLHGGTEDRSATRRRARPPSSAPCTVARIAAMPEARRRSARRLRARPARS